MSKTTNRYSPEVRKRAMRLLQENEGRHESRWAAMVSIAEKIGCNPETLRGWVRQDERDAGKQPGLTSDERSREKSLGREGRELRQANDILRKASACFAAAERDRA